VSRAQITALVLSLRRRAEADAQEQLRRTCAQLELCRAGLFAAQRQLEQGLGELAGLLYQEQQRGTDIDIDIDIHRADTALLARDLVSQSERLLRQRRLVADLQHAALAQTTQLQGLMQRESELRAALRLALARREAAELHESQERSEARRNRANRQRTLEEEARDRFLSAQRQGKGSRS
jgi:hypothetical protein